MLEVLWLLFAWLPSPLNVLAFGLVCILILVACIKLLAIIFDMIPFL